ncbi:MAG: Mrp/NBP35 family ATP-binding protein [Rhizobiales bacterium]|nr:Mrp/NBP35 family ATP-binding protein [Hyphomicrobiales bacterium]
MSDVTPEQVREKLRRVKGPDLEGDIVELGLVSDIVVNDGKVIFSISIDPERAKELEPLRLAAQEVTEKIDGVVQVLVGLTSHSKKPNSGGNSAPQRKPAPGAGSGTLPPPMAAQAGKAPAQQPKAGVPGVGAIIAVASGKGGVGKSTTAANLALAFQANGLTVGVLDADIYGPSMPRLLNTSGRPQNDGRILKPLEGYGLKVMSMGFLVDEDTPMIWRGPMVISALTQMLREVAWGELDVLVVDMPPGTGDAQLTMAQQVPLAGAIIVSTPQDLALLDARKGINMFRKVDVPILGIVENMSYYLCPHCGERSEIFGHGGARAEAEKMGAEFLGEVPLNIEIRKTSDEGHPIVISDPKSAYARIYLDIATKAWAEVERNRLSEAHVAPNIVIE